MGLAGMSADVQATLNEVQEEMGHLAARVIQQHHQSFLHKKIDILEKLSLRFLDP